MATSLGERLQAQAEALQKYLEQVGEKKFMAPNYRPDGNSAADGGGWDYQPFNHAGLSAAYDRQEHDAAVAKALNLDQPGTIGDLAIHTVQADLLACLERSYRLRLASPLRRRAHADAVARGHGHAAGIWERGLQNMIDNLAKRNTKG